MLGNTILTFHSTKSGIVYKYANHGTLIELIWTITPALVLIAIAFPSFKLLYMMDEVLSPSMTIKAVGHQWYWSYEYSDFITDDGESIEFDSYMVPESDLEEGQLRLLSVDSPVVVPVDTHVRFILTGADVIHDFAVPSLGLKADCCPGRLNQVSILVEREGTFYGQCSEICGVYHGFMPIMVKAVSSEEFMAWIDEMAGLSPHPHLIYFPFSLLFSVYKLKHRTCSEPNNIKITTLFNILELLIVLVPTLMSVAFITIIERKVMGSMQRRIGPNIVGYYGLLQPFADALKLVVKEQVIPSHADKYLFFLAPMISLVFSLLG